MENEMKLGLDGQIAVVTGASRGIGAGIAEELAREGMSVVLAGRDEEALANVARSIQSKHGRDTEICSGDLRETLAIRAVVDAAIRRFGKINLVVNCAGATKRGDFFKLTDEDWTDSFAMKFFGYVRMSREAWPHLKKSGGSIVNIAGIGARTPSAEFAIGGSVNSALLNFSKALADLGSVENVRVNAINPGLIQTDRFVRRVDAYAKTHNVSPQEAQIEILKEAGIKRVGTVQEVATLVAYLASDHAAFIHGSAIDIDGGETKGI
jgi:NAD(P)-dependent dehydrogenase (short-subunit alcohol dehydrogenase family)